MHKLYEYADERNLKKKGVIECDDALRALCQKDEFRFSEVMISFRSTRFLLHARSGVPAPRRVRNAPRAGEGAEAQGEDD